MDLTELDEIPVEMCFQSLQEDDHPPVREEVLSALSKLKNYKSPGIDGICNEQLKYGAQGLTNPLLKLFGVVWESERVPEDWLKGVITIIPKKGDTSVCSNNRGITLRSTTSKLFQMVVLGRLSEGLEVAMRENQCGFRKNRSCVDQIYSLRAIIRQCTEHNLPLYVNFIDFKSAFDCINRDFIWKAFRHYGLPEKYVRVIRAFFDGTVSAVRHDGELSRWFEVASGTGQGDIQGPPIFNVLTGLHNWRKSTRPSRKGWCFIRRLRTLRRRWSWTQTMQMTWRFLMNDGTKDGLQESTDLLSHYAAYLRRHVYA